MQAAQASSDRAAHSQRRRRDLKGLNERFRVDGGPHGRESTTGPGKCLDAQDGMARGVAAYLMRVDENTNRQLAEPRQRHPEIDRKNQTLVEIEFVLEFLRERFVRMAMPRNDPVGGKRRRERNQNERDEDQRRKLRNRVSPYPSEALRTT